MICCFGRVAFVVVSLRADVQRLHRRFTAFFVKLIFRRGKCKRETLVLLFCAVVSCSSPVRRRAGAKKRWRAIFQAAIEINTTDSVATDHRRGAMATRLRDGGFAKATSTWLPRSVRKNLVVRLHGTGKRKPILFRTPRRCRGAPRGLATDPSNLSKRWYFYGRGTEDIRKAMPSCHQFHPAEKRRVRTIVMDPRADLRRRRRHLHGRRLAPEERRRLD